MRNVLAAAWSPEGLLAFMTRAAWRGPKNVVHVVDPRNGFATLAKMEIEGHPDRPTACLAFVGERLLAHVGGPTVMWDAKTGEEIDRASIDGWIFELYPDASIGLNAQGLHIVNLLGGSRFRLSFDAQWLTPIAAPADDWVVVDGAWLRRVAPAGAIRWSAPHPQRPNAFAADPSTVVVGSNAEKKVWLFDAQTGAERATIATGDHIPSCGVLADGTVWFLEHKGRLAFHRPDGTLQRETRMHDALCMSAALSHDASMIAVSDDLLELRSCLRVASTATGETLWESKSRANRAPAARSKAGAAITAKDGKIWKKGSKEPIGAYAGEVLLAMSKDGAIALVADCETVRVIDVATGRESIRHSLAKLEEDTIAEVVDKVLFDASGRPCVKVEAHTFVVAEEGFVSGKPAKKPARRRR